MRRQAGYEFMARSDGANCPPAINNKGILTPRSSRKIKHMRRQAGHESMAWSDGVNCPPAINTISGLGFSHELGQLDPSFNLTYTQDWTYQTRAVVYNYHAAISNVLIQRGICLPQSQKVFKKVYNK